MFFRLSTSVLALTLFDGDRRSHRARPLDRPICAAQGGQPAGAVAVMQAALLGFTGLVLAFGLSLAVERHEGRRAAVVAEANAIGTSFRRSQTLTEPVRTRSLTLLRRFNDTSIRISETIPDSASQQDAIADSGQVQRDLWALAGQALQRDPAGSATLLYVESLDETFGSQSSRVYGLSDRVPTPVLLLEVTGSAVALGLQPYTSALLAEA